MNSEKIIVTTGIFDPLTVKELNFLQRCKNKGDWLIVGLYSDINLHLKTGILNQTYENRFQIMTSIKCVDEVMRFNDADGTVCNLLKIVKFCYPLANITYITDSDMHNMPEKRIKGINFETLNKE